MKTTIDGAGRVIVPKKIRDAVGLEDGSEIDVRAENGVIQMAPIAPPEKTGTMSQEIVEETLESDRGERGRAGAGKTRRS
jgi:AbrB family looped-hinge helix DNA binding protein